MPRFRFPLQPLLNAREHEERLKQRVVAEIEAERQSVEEKLRDQQQFITSGKHGLRGQLQGELDLSTLRQHAGNTMRGMRDAQRLAIELAGIYQRLQEARAELTDAARARRAVELLRERRFAEWKQRLDTAENEALDEFAMQDAARRAREQSTS